MENVNFDVDKRKVGLNGVFCACSWPLLN